VKRAKQQQNSNNNKPKDECQSEMDDFPVHHPRRRDFALDALAISRGVNFRFVVATARQHIMSRTST